MAADHHAGAEIEAVVVIRLAQWVLLLSEENLSCLSCAYMAMRVLILSFG
jgi:hypothetical protein